MLHATGERSLGKLGGLIRHMPWVAWLALVGALASAGLPPLSGFVSEWLLLQASCSRRACRSSFLNMLVPVVAALLALVAALAGYMMVKFFGVVFLGQPREDEARARARRRRLGARRHALAGGRLRRARPVAGPVHPASSTRSRALLVGAGLGAAPWPTAAGCSRRSTLERASYSPVIFLLGDRGELSRSPIVLVRRLYHGRLRRAPPWDCGFPWQTARMQDTAEGFGQPIRQIFEPFFRIERELPSPFDREPRYRVDVERPLLALALPADRRASSSGSRGWSACCSRAASRSTCCTASSTLLALLLRSMR